MMADDGRGLLYIPLLGYAHGDFDALHDMLVHPGSVLGLGDGGAHCGLLCDASLPTYMLTHWVRDRSRGTRLGLEQAVHMQTRRPRRCTGSTTGACWRPATWPTSTSSTSTPSPATRRRWSTTCPPAGRRLDPASPRLRRHGQARRGRPRGRRGHRRAPGRAAPGRPTGPDGLAGPASADGRHVSGPSPASFTTRCGRRNAAETLVSHAVGVAGALTGHTIGITGHRRWEEQAEMLTRRGAQVVHGPVMHTTLLHDSDATLRATEQALADPPDLVVLTTGIGTRSWFAAAESAGLDGRLRDAGGAATVLARGPKARSAAIGAGLDVDWQAGDETSAEVLRHVATLDVAGRRVVVQRDGGDPLLADRHPRPRRPRRRRPRVPLAPPRRHRPGAAVDRRRLRRAPRRRHVHLRVRGGQHVRPRSRPRRAARRPRRSRARHRRRPGVRGRPAAPRRRAGRRAARARLGAMVKALVAALEARHRCCATRARPSAGRARPWSTRRPARSTTLTPGEARVLDVLVARAPAVVPKSALVDDGVDTHAAEAPSPGCGPSSARWARPSARSRAGATSARSGSSPQTGVPATVPASPDPRRRQRPDAGRQGLDLHRALLVVGLAADRVELVVGQPVDAALVPVERDEHLAGPHDGGDPDPDLVDRAPGRGRPAPSRRRGRRAGRRRPGASRPRPRATAPRGSGCDRSSCGCASARRCARC